MKKKSTTVTAAELYEIIDELFADVDEQIKKMTPAQRKKDRDDSKNWKVITKRNKNSVTIELRKETQ
jgi:hypothetical protein